MAHSEESDTIRQLHEIFDAVDADFRAEGREQGREEVFRANLLLLLERRFGRPPESALVRIYRAGSATLDEWLDRAITADTLGAVFADRDSDTSTPTAAERIQAQTRPFGRLEAQRKSVTLLLARRFGDLPERLRDRIWRAELGELDRWFDRGISAPSLEVVFADEP